MSSCPYSSDELDYWDGVANPMGSACNECGEFECEHNCNYLYSYDYEDFEEGGA